MKIRSGMGGYPLQQAGQTQKTSKTTKKSATKKSGDVGATEKTESVGAVVALGALEAPDPVFDAVAEASRKMDMDEASLEEATKAVVSAVIREHFGKKNLPEKTLNEITQAVSTSVSNDATLSSRLESILKRITNNKTK
jgi:hypothetical protein